MRKLQLNKLALLIACAHFLISFFTDRFFFQYVLMDFSDLKNTFRTVETWIVKVAFLILLIALWQGVFYLKDKADTTFKKIFILYFLFMMFLLLLSWPGIWRNDEFGLLSSASQLYPLFWQNYLSSVFYIFSLMLLPFPAGVIVIQCVCISLIVARIMTNLIWFVSTNEKYGNKWMVRIAFITFFMFPVLDSNLYPIRMSLYAFLELLLITELFFCFQKEKQDKNESNHISIAVLLLAAIVSVWRAEAIYYIILFPLILIIFCQNKQWIKPICLYFAIFLALFLPQKVGDLMTDGQQYELTSVVLPLVPLVQQASINQDIELLKQIDPIMNTEVILTEAQKGKTGIQMFWEHPEFQEKKDESSFRDFKNAYYKLVKKYPVIFIKERFHTFLVTNDVLDNTLLLYQDMENPNYKVFRSYPLSETRWDGMRTVVIKTLEIKEGVAGENKRKITNVIYSAIPPILFLLLFWASLLLKKRWRYAVLLLLVCAKFPLIFLTAPSRLFMYYYSIYLLGYFILWCLIGLGIGVLLERFYIKNRLRTIR